jgi:hypothetical protein
MAKIKEKVPSPSQAKDKETKSKSILVGRVKKVIKKSRRKMGEEKFEKELRRTIEFLAQLQMKLGDSNGVRENGKAPGKVEKKPAPKAETKFETKSARKAPKKGHPDKKNGKKPAGKGGGKKSRDEAPAVDPVMMRADAASKER